VLSRFVWQGLGVAYKNLLRKTSGLQEIIGCCPFHSTFVRLYFSRLFRFPNIPRRCGPFLGKKLQPNFFSISWKKLQPKNFFGFFFGLSISWKEIAALKLSSYLAQAADGRGTSCRLHRALSSAWDASWLLGALLCICRTPATSPSRLKAKGAFRAGDADVDGSPFPLSATRNQISRRPKRRRPRKYKRHDT